MEVRLLPRSQFFHYTRAFRSWLYRLALEASVRRFEPCRSDQFSRTRSPIGRGACLRKKLMKGGKSSRVYQIKSGHRQEAQGDGLQSRLSPVRIRVPAPPILDIRFQILDRSRSSYADPTRSKIENRKFYVVRSSTGQSTSL